MKEFTISNGETWKVDPGFNLYIDVTSACNASCAFCIAPTVGRKDGANFFGGLEYALDMTESVNGTIQIVGGEPTISRRLPEILRLIGQRSYRRVVLNTNGSRLTPELMDLMTAAGVTYVNISRHHYDERCNQDIMHLRPELPNAAVVRAVDRILNADMRVRMQCNLIRGYVDSFGAMERYIEWCAAIGCNTVSFSQIFPLSLFDYQKPIELGYTEKVQINLRRLVADVDASGQFKPFENAELDNSIARAHGGGGSSSWGSYKRRYWHGPGDATVSIKVLSGYDAAGLPKETCYDKTSDPELQDGYLAFAVVHSDGRVTASWDRRERILFDADPLFVSHGTIELPMVEVGHTRG